MNQVDKNEDGDCTDEKMVPDSTCLSPWVTGSGAFNHSNFQVPTLHRAVPPFMFVNRKSLELYVRSGIVYILLTYQLMYYYITICNCELYNFATNNIFPHACKHFYKLSCY